MLAIGSMGDAGAAATTHVGLITVLDGQAQLLRGAQVLVGAAGIALQEGDAVETGDSSFAQLEFSGGLLMALGPSSRIIVFGAPRSPARTSPRPHIAVLRGWIKVESTPAQGIEPLRLSSLDLSALCGRTTMVVRVAPTGTQLFVESGRAELTPVGGAQRMIVVTAGQFVHHTPSLALVVQPEPSAGFLTELPRTFRDTLPPMGARIPEQLAAPGLLREASYEDVEDLLTLPRPWRAGFVPRFRSRLRDDAFRTALDANMRRHPEWDPVLHPEKYLPPTETGQATGGLSADGGTRR